MTEPDERDALAPTVKDGPTRPVTFKGREIETVEPTDEQFLAIVRLSKLPSSGDGLSAHRMLATLNRVPELVRALCASEEDAEWFEDGLVNSTLKIVDLPEFCADTMIAWWADKNRTTKRAAKKAGARIVRPTR